MASAIVLSCALLLAGSVNSLRDPNLPHVFFPFGADVGDEVVPVADEGSSPGLHVSDGFPFFNVSRNIVYVNSNGLISFGAAISDEYTPRLLPISSPSSPFIAPYWADVDTTNNNGRIYYRNVTDVPTLSRASRDVVSVCSSWSSFEARWAMIVTWHNVTFHGASSTPPPTNTFQAVLATNGRTSFALFHYGNLTWTTGVLSGGSPTTGRGGNPAAVGFNNGDGVNYYLQPSSLTDAVRFIFARSNVAVRGRWLYRVDCRNISSCQCPVDSPPAESSTGTTTTRRSTTSPDSKHLSTDASTTTTTLSSSSLSSTNAIPETRSGEDYTLIVILAVVSAVLLVAIIIVGCRFILNKVSRRADVASQSTAFSNVYHELELEQDSVTGDDSAQPSETTRDGYITVNFKSDPYQELTNSGLNDAHPYDLPSLV